MSDAPSSTATVRLDARAASHFEEALRRALAEANIVVVTDNIAGRGRPQSPGEAAGAPRENIITADDIAGRAAGKEADQIITIDDIAGRHRGQPRDDDASAPRENIITTDDIAGRRVSENATLAKDVALDAAEAVRFFRHLEARMDEARAGDPGAATAVEAP
jgi:hypothetical protein